MQLFMKLPGFFIQPAIPALTPSRLTLITCLSVDTILNDNIETIRDTVCCGFILVSIGSQCLLKFFKFDLGVVTPTVLVTHQQKY